MNNNDERDYAEERANQGDMEREGRSEYCNKTECPNPSWVRGMMVVSEWDVESVYRELKRTGNEAQLIDEKCDRQYHPDFSADPYDF